MASLFMDNPENDELINLAKGYAEEKEFVKALEVIEDSIWTLGRDKVPGRVHFIQGSIMFDIAYGLENNDLMKFAFFLASAECFLLDLGLDARGAVSLLETAKTLGSVVYYKKAWKLAEESLSIRDHYMNQHDKAHQTIKLALEHIIESAGEMIRLDRLAVQKSEGKLWEPKEEVPETTRSNSITAAVDKRLRSYWAGMNVESKRNFLKVSIEKLRGYVQRFYGQEGLNVLEQVIDFAKVNKKWRFWMCRTCSQKFFYPKKLRNHLEQEHAAKFKPFTTKLVDKKWADMVSVGGWEPVNAVAATDLIKTQLESVKAFVYDNGWSKGWPLAADEKRSMLLKEIQSLLVSFWNRNILSCGARDWLMQFSVSHLAPFEVSEQTLTTECRLVETPQIICFLGSPELDNILDLLKKIKCKRDDGADLICRAVDSEWGLTRVKEKIELDSKSSFMLLDKRLLRGQIASFDDEGPINVNSDHNVYYAKTLPQGDDVITWLLDCPLMDDRFGFPKPVRLYNLVTWVAVLRNIQFTCRTLGAKYKKKSQILSYCAALIDAKNLCVREDKRRSNIPNDQWDTYASLLVNECDDRIKTQTGDFLDTTRLFLCAVLDVLEGALHPTFDFPDLDKHLTRIHGLQNLSNDEVLNSIDLLKSVVTNKVPLMESKILLVENSRVNLLNDLARLSIFDYRAYILQLLKRFLREDLDETVAALAEVKLLSEKKQEEKKSGSKKKKHSSNKRTSTSMSSPLDQNVKHESSVNLEPKVASPSLETVEEESMEQEETLSCEMGRLEISSSSDNQEEAAKACHLQDMQITSEEDSLSKQWESAHGTAATRCSSALDMTLEALCNIKVLKEKLLQNRHLFPDNLEKQGHLSPDNLKEQVSCALQNFLTAFVSEQIKEEGEYSHLLSVLLASLEEVCSIMPSRAAEFLVSILEFWPCWKSLERESLVTWLFMLEEYERMSCSKCKRKSNYSEQSSYGIVMAADSIRELKCAFGDIKFEEILKVIRMENKLLCEIKTGGCGKANFVQHRISRRPRIFTIVLEWERDETEKEISETANALNWEIDISRLYEDLKPNTKYRLVSMVGCGEEKEHICLAYKENRWFSFRHETLAKEGVGNWKNVVEFCRVKKVRPEILFYEAFQWPDE